MSINTESGSNITGNFRIKKQTNKQTFCFLNTEISIEKYHFSEFDRKYLYFNLLSCILSFLCKKINCSSNFTAGNVRKITEEFPSIKQ